VNKNIKMRQILITLIILEITSNLTSATPLHKTISSSPHKITDTEKSSKIFNWESREYETGSKYIDSFTSNEIKSNHETSNDSDFAPQDKEHESIEKNPTNCRTCKNSDTLSEDDLTKLRIEYVKKQILHKLRMNDRPIHLRKSDLPEPVQIGYALKTDEDDKEFNRRANEDFAKTTQKIIFMTQGKYFYYFSMVFQFSMNLISLPLDNEKCKSKDSSLCFDFQLPTEIDYSDITSAHLWVYKQPGKKSKKIVNLTCVSSH
jgi:hypothetical protein